MGLMQAVEGRFIFAAVYFVAFVLVIPHSPDTNRA